MGLLRKHGVMVGAVGVLLAATGVSAAEAERTAPVVTNAQLGAAVKAIARLPDWQVMQQSYDFGSKAPLKIVRVSKSPSKAVAALAKSFQVSPEAARLWLAALGSQCGDCDASELQRTKSLFVAAARSSQCATPVMRSFVAFQGEPSPASSAALVEMLAACPDPVAAAIGLVKSVGPSLRWSTSVIATWTVTHNPRSLPTVLESLPQRMGWDNLAAFRFAAVNVMLTDQAAYARHLNPTAIELAKDLVEHGHPALLVELYERSPSSLQKALLAEARVRLELAAAYLAKGDKESAQALRPEAPKVASSGAPDSACQAELEFGLINASFRPLKDPFRLAVNVMECGPARPPWSLLAARALGSSYPDAVMPKLREPSRDDRSGGAPDWDHADPAFSFTRAAYDAFASDRSAQAKQVEAARNALRADHAPPVDSVHAAIVAATAASSPVTFAERPLAEVLKESKIRPVPVSLPEEKLGPGLWIQRAERIGTGRVVVLALSQNFDPVGEVSGGAYWLAESFDNGKTFTRLTYLGLGEYRPYQFADRSQIPLLEGDWVRLEGSVKELDEESITFPPVGLRSKREQEGIVVEARYSELRRDSDDDGFTDLAELRLLLDPRNADTDGDGLTDRADPHPQISTQQRKAKSTSRQQVMAAFFAEQNEPDLKGLVVGTHAEPGQLGLPRGEAPQSPEDVLFVEGDRSDFADVESARRLIVLSPEELSAAKNRFGAFYPMQVRVLVNEAGDEAYIQWSEGWRGGTYRAAKHDGKWELSELKSWIT